MKRILLFCLAMAAPAQAEELRLLSEYTTDTAVWEQLDFANLRVGSDDTMTTDTRHALMNYVPEVTAGIERRRNNSIAVDALTDAQADAMLELVEHIALARLVNEILQVIEIKKAEMLEMIGKLPVPLS